MLLVPPPGEQARLDAHFVRVLSRLHSRPPARLGAAAARARARHLERLDAYRRRAVFPKNRRFFGRALPHFVDESGTRCAMAHLIEGGTGALPDLVRYVASERNFDRIVTLADIPELCAWLESNGLTLEEAAMIQPSYCATPAESCVCSVAAQGMLVRGLADEYGSSITVEDLYGTLGVKVGDVLALSSHVPANNIVFANVYSTGADAGMVAAPRFTAASETAWVLVGSTCPLVVPGPLPFGVLNDALSQNITACSEVLVAYDPAWGVVSGMNCGPEEPGAPSPGNGDSDSGCSISGGGAGGMAVLFASMLVLRLLRRRVS